MKNVFKKIIIFLLFLVTPVASAKFREINSTGYEDEIPVVNVDEVEKAANVPTFETVNAIKDNNEKLYGVVGKSQVVNFDKNIERISITDDSIADIVVLTPKQLLINGKKPGATSIIFWSENSQKPIFYNLVIRQNTDSFLQAVECVAPNENMSIIFNDTGAVLTGRISSTAVKEKIVNLAKAYKMDLTDMTESPSKQVLLEVKITEASKNFARTLGLNLVQGRRLDLSSFQAGQWGPNSADFKGSAHVIQTGEGLVLGYFKGGKLGVDFEASEAKGDIKILAEPKLLSVNGEEGSFAVGNQVPVPSEMGQYGNVSYEYKDTGVILKFTPTIMEDSGRIRLNLKPEVSEVDNSVSVTSGQGAAVYGFKTRRVETTVELMDGETLVIAGLLRNSSSRSRTQVPILGNIPIIGAFFSMTNDDKEDDELVIFITPKIVDNSIPADNL